MQAAPDIPTMTELGYPMNIRSWWAALVPAGTPKPIVDQLNEWFSQVVRTEESKKFLNGIASDPWASSPQEGQAYFLQQIEDWAEYVRIARIEPQG
jgi:tripartite-type tricarboxylate transporter receptor subunit TctC